MKYQMLVRILDEICKEAPPTYAKYWPAADDIDALNQARSRAYVHLYLKVKFGLIEFAERERQITDGSSDGGIDGYLIDEQCKRIYLIQSKFRTTEKNFEEKEISLEELLAMDIERILEGETHSEDGSEYNGKIKGLQRQISSLPDIGRYSYQVVILANLTKVAGSKLRQLAAGCAVEVLDFASAYRDLVLPVVTGTYFTASDISIPIDLSAKNAGSKISYSVRTQYGTCEITVLFVPTLEIAKLMHKYKNAVLAFNPRSYLELVGQSVNEAIRETILKSETNEFALYNNGITMLSEETNINERIGQKNKAQLHVKNPQIINGGQTSFTLSRIYSDNIQDAATRFSEKEVLLKVITIMDTVAEASRRHLIEEISNATNQQTPVISADRYSNDAFHVDMQRMVFGQYGLLYERKRGEFSDGVHDKYVKPDEIVERNHFWRLYFTANGRITRGFQKSLFQRNDFEGVEIRDTDAFDRFFLAEQVFKRIRVKIPRNMRVEKSAYGTTYAYIRLFLSDGLRPSVATIDKNLETLAAYWATFLDLQAKERGPGHEARIDPKTGEAKLVFVERRYYASHRFERDLIDYIDSLVARAPLAKEKPD